MAGQLTIDTLKASSGILANVNGMDGIAKAWVNFNGVTTATVRAAFNVSSVVRNAAGDYTVNFTNAMQDANYVVVTAAAGGASGSCVLGGNTISSNDIVYSTGSVRVYAPDCSSNTNTDIAYANVAIFR